MVIEAHWPGATALEIANQVTQPIETKLKTISSRSKIISFSRQNKSTIIFQVRGDINADETPIIWSNVRNKVKDIQNLLPKGAVGITFNDDFGDTFGIIYALNSPGYSPKITDRFVRDIREKFLSIKDVGRVEIFGQQREKIYIEISRRILNKYNLTAEDLSRQLGENNFIALSGNIEQEKLDTTIRVNSTYKTVDQIRNTRINTAKDIVILGEIAKIYRSFPDPFEQKVKVNGLEAIAIGISMKKGGDIIKLGKSVDKKVTEITQNLPVGMELAKIQNQPKAVSKTVDEFLVVLFEAISIVLIASLISLGIKRNPLSFDIKPGLIVAISIPLVMAITFMIMKLLGIGLHKVSLGALIISLGLLVDDAIIVIEMMFKKVEQGVSLIEAVASSYATTAMPMLTGTLITALGFLPIGLANSEVGEYTFAIFAVTGISLLVSWFVSIFFVPVFGYWMISMSKKKKSSKHEISRMDNHETLRNILNFSMSKKLISLSIIFFIFLLGFLSFKNVEKQFFPDSNRSEILVDVYLPERSSTRETEAVVKKLEKKVMEMPNILNVVSWLGSGAPRFFLPIDIIFPNPNVAQLVITPDKREVRDEISEKIRDMASTIIPEARVRVKVLPNGPPVPYPVSFRLLSDDEKNLKEAASKVQTILAKHPNLINVHNNWGIKSSIINLSVDDARAREFGITPFKIAEALKVRSYGTEIGEFRDDKLLLPILFRLNKNDRDEVFDLRGIIISSEKGEAIPLDKIVKFSVDWEYPVIWRYDNKFSMSIQADTVGELQSPTITNQVLLEINKIKNEFADNVELQVGGTVEESSKGQNSIITGLPIMFFLIFTLLVIQLSSVSKSLLVFVTAPLGVSGALFALILFDMPLGFVAGLGIVALIGMIIRNSVILVDQIERERLSGKDVLNSVVDATLGRFRPIILTAGTAALAMVPLTKSIFWGPMAVAIMGGLVIATILSLILIPILYSIFYSEKTSSKIF
jgi:multidrug efflux pump subunit AcrB